MQHNLNQWWSSNIYSTGVLLQHVNSVGIGRLLYAVYNVGLVPVLVVSSATKSFSCPRPARLNLWSWRPVLSCSVFPFQCSTSASPRPSWAWTSCARQSPVWARQLCSCSPPCSRLSPLMDRYVQGLWITHCDAMLYTRGCKNKKIINSVGLYLKGCIVMLIKKSSIWVD